MHNFSLLLILTRFLLKVTRYVLKTWMHISISQETNNGVRKIPKSAWMVVAKAFSESIEEFYEEAWIQNQSNHREIYFYLFYYYFYSLLPLSRKKSQMPISLKVLQEPIFRIPSQILLNLLSVKFLMVTSTLLLETQPPLTVLRRLTIKLYWNYLQNIPLIFRSVCGNLFPSSLCCYLAYVSIGEHAHVVLEQLEKVSAFSVKIFHLKRFSPTKRVENWMLL